MKVIGKQFGSQDLAQEARACRGLFQKSHAIGGQPPPDSIGGKTLAGHVGVPQTEAPRRLYSDSAGWRRPLPAPGRHACATSSSSTRFYRRVRHWLRPIGGEAGPNDHFTLGRRRSALRPIRPDIAPVGSPRERVPSDGEEGEFLVSLPRKLVEVLSCRPSTGPLSPLDRKCAAIVARIVGRVRPCCAIGCTRGDPLAGGFAPYLDRCTPPKAPPRPDLVALYPFGPHLRKVGHFICELPSPPPPPPRGGSAPGPGPQTFILNLDQSHAFRRRRCPNLPVRYLLRFAAATLTSGPMFGESVAPGDVVIVD